MNRIRFTQKQIETQKEATYHTYIISNDNEDTMRYVCLLWEITNRHMIE